jgi:hypothetical protein
MNASSHTLKLIMSGNVNVPAAINAIIRATLEARQNTQNSTLVFRQIHIFHTEQSLQAMMSMPNPWQQALSEYGISTTSIVHHVTKLEESSIDRFRDLVEQLRTIVNPLDNSHYYVDLTGGVSALKSILAVLAYVLDIEHIYSLEIEFSSDPGIRSQQTGMFYKELEQAKVKMEYRQFPPIKEFDLFGRLNYTEVLRHRQVIASLTQSLAALLPVGFDLDHLQASLLSGINSRLWGEVTGESYNYRHSVFSSSAGVEEMANVMLTFIQGSDLEKKTLGDKLGEINHFIANNPKYFINTKVLEHLTHLMAAVRNDVVHPSSGIERDKETTAIQSYLSSQLSVAFLQFTIKALSVFLNEQGKIIDISVIEGAESSDGSLFYFGFDGDATGDYLELAFGDLVQDESEVLNRSRKLKGAIKKLRNIICKKTQSSSSVLFAEGDNILFKAPYCQDLLNKLQQAYTDETGLHCSIGYGKNLQEATIAMRLSKGKQGNSIVGVVVKGNSINSSSAL